ncbi:DNA polymerase/3'-5' exonuclease PolX [Candidatus Woesearchaeota archaeon]|nr:DNA polymerase/3'-5' exonuclease PolX [Candidatus Woesearchaeota archaeon]
MSNKEVAQIFYDIADILEIQDVQFKPRAYEKAAQEIELLPELLSKYYEENVIDNIPGIGKSITEKIREILETGKLRYFEKLKKKLPEGIFKLMQVSGIGPKRIKKLHIELKIRSLSDLNKAIKQHKIQELEGFGKKSEEDLEEGLKLVKQRETRLLLGDVYPSAMELVKKLKTVAKDVTLAGSVLRMKETVHDVDILATSDMPGKIIQYFTELSQIKRVLAKGSTKASIMTKDNVQIDLRVVKPGLYGSAFQYFAGSKEHNIALRKIAINKGYKLNEYGLFLRKTGRVIESKDEKKIYQKLGLQWVPPEIREYNGEIEAAQKNRIPQLIEFNDMQGDLHTHTNYSHGDNSLTEMVEAAKKLGYSYIGITDHSKTLRIAKGMPVNKLLGQIKEIDQLNGSVNGIKVLKSAEVDILVDGSLDYSDDVLKQLDYVLASIHSGFNKDNTKRVLKAMDNDYVKIIGHPTGRLINARDSFSLNFTKIFAKARERDIALEINSQPLRLDLKDSFIREAVEQKVKLAINTDAHSTYQLNNMIYGIGQARRGWAKKCDVINTMSYSELIKFFKK